jgi:glucose/arabinose dehydrogenase
MGSRCAAGLVLAVLAWSLAPATVRAERCSAGTLTGTAAVLSDWSDDRPGRCRLIRPRDLAQPGESNSSQSRVQPIPEGVLPDVPRGFKVRRFHRGADKPRLIRTAPNGDIFVAESLAGRIRVLRPSGVCELGEVGRFATGLDRPFGIDFYPPGPDPRWVYVAEEGRVLRFPYRSGDLEARDEPEVIVHNLPRGADDLPGKGHWTRDVQFSRNGSLMYVSVGSYSNVAEKPNVDERRRARIVAYAPDGSDRQVIATGLRNPVSMALDPGGGIWTTNNERDRLGDDLVPDFVTWISEGHFFGWPWYYIGDNRDTRPVTDPPRDLPPVRIPAVLLQAHSAPLGMTFYDHGQFPGDYRRSIFVALHGSWNRANPTGAKVVRIPYSNGKAEDYYEDFMTGFTIANHEVLGRPVGVTVGNGGSLYVSEDANNMIYCVNWVGNG